MKTLSHRLLTVFLLTLLLCAGVYILFLRDRCEILRDKCHGKSLELTGNKFTWILKRYRDENGKYPASLNELVPEYLPSLYSYGLGYFSDPYHWDAVEKYRKNKGEWPTSLEQLVPKYLSDLSHVDWEYSCDPNGLAYELSLSCDISLYEELLSFDSEGHIYLHRSSMRIR